ncbi:hypothetical protein SCB71_06220 [Herbiconiux sp. KACC 21604]|uniref:hypothetical protein n=1 Tax=unclassified Herbiconiux TaxID=2618217 RepID=UPI0014920962|nr:hypothetical protein [Herbiconiux sp. SALV-R1]QJU52914.1 hypothetical protein HL652_04210 [Herbiconiux sp. SALV-R1]WPO87833.1 hypothetical protein SCB71_06220 [Herbiconiux sp. KACC 21604]
MAYGKQKDRESRREAERAIAEAGREPVWERPPRVEWDPEERYETVPDLSAPENVLIYRTAMWKRRFVDFAIIHEIRDGSQNATVAKADSSLQHEDVHLHVKARSNGKDVKREVIRFISSQKDIDDGYYESDSRILEDMSKHEMMWRNGR